MRLRKALSILLTICMVLTTVSPAFAEEIPAETFETIEESVQQEETEETESEAVESETAVYEAEESETAVTEATESEAVSEDQSDTETEEIKEETESAADIVLTAELDDVIVTLKADADAFDNKGELSLRVTPVEIAETEEEALDAVEKENVAKRATYDITVLDDGEEIEPVKEVKVSFELKDAPSGADGVNIYHHDEEDGIEKIATEVLKEDAKEETVSISEEKIETAETEKKEEKSADKTIEVKEVDEEELAATDDVELIDDVTVETTTDAFSLYTVDFTYKDKTISIAGDSKGNKLDDIVDQLGIEEKVEEATTYQDAECTEEVENGEVKEDGKTLFSVYEINDTWYVDAVNAFDTEHGLVVKTADGAEYKIKVTDASETAVLHFQNWDSTQEKLVDAFIGTGSTIATTYTIINSSNNETILKAGWYVVDGTVKLSKSAYCDGAVHLILKDNCNLTVEATNGCAGICILEGDDKSLTIYGQSGGTGKLSSTGSGLGAGIGSSLLYAGENITINGGDITAIGGDTGGAGIGGGNDTSGNNITINGGTIFATGNGGGAGIGGGIRYDGKNITINGGTITAISNGGGDGIGKGSNGPDGSTVFAADNIVVKADNTNPPTTVIEHTSPSMNIASELDGKKYVKTNSTHKINKITSTAISIYLEDDAMEEATAIEIADNKFPEATNTTLIVYSKTSGTPGTYNILQKSNGTWETSMTGISLDGIKGMLSQATFYVIGTVKEPSSKWTKLTAKTISITLDNDAMSEVTARYLVETKLTNPSDGDAAFYSKSTSVEGEYNLLAYSGSAWVNATSTLSDMLKNVASHDIYVLGTITECDWSELTSNTTSITLSDDETTSADAISYAKSKSIANPSYVVYKKAEEGKYNVIIGSGDTWDASNPQTFTLSDLKNAMGSGIKVYVIGTTYTWMSVPDKNNSIFTFTDESMTQATAKAIAGEEITSPSDNDTVVYAKDDTGYFALIYCGGAWIENTFSTLAGVLYALDYGKLYIIGTAATPIVTKITSNTTAITPNDTVTYVYDACGVAINNPTLSGVTDEGFLVYKKTGDKYTGILFERGYWTESTSDKTLAELKSMTNAYVIGTVTDPTTYTVTCTTPTHGTVSVDKSSASSGETITINTTPAEGYVLDTLTATDAGGSAVTITSNTFTMPAADVTVTATFKIPTYNVTYDGNGAVSGATPSDATEYAYNTSVTVLGNTGSLAKTGYTFAGWNTQADGKGTSYAAGDTFNITANTTLYAKWSESGVKNETELTEAIKNASKGDIIKLIANINLTSTVSIASEKDIILDLDGYVLKGAGTDSVITNKGKLTVKDSNTNKQTHKFSVDSTTGLWTLDETSGSKEVNGGCITGGNSGTNNGGGIITWEGSTLTMTGGNICGNQAAQGGGLYTGSNTTVSLSNVTISGNYATNNCGGVMFNADKNDKTPDPSLTINGTVKIIENTSPEGKDKNLTLWTNEAPLVIGSSIAGSKIGVTIRTSGVPAAGAFTTTDNVTAAEAAYFISDADAYGVAFVTDHLELKNKYTVTFDVQGHGTAQQSQSVVSGGTVTKPASPSETGYSFGGWYKEAACSTAWDFANDTVTAATTLYAKWSESRVKDETELTNAITNAKKGDTIKLGADIDLTKTVEIVTDKEIILDLNGHVLNAGKIITPTQIGGKASVICIYNGGKLTIIDSQPETAHTDWNTEHPTSGGNADLSGVKGGVLTGGKGELGVDGTSGGAISNGGILSITGITLTGNTAAYGGAVMNTMGSTLTMSGVTITNNSATSVGGGIMSVGSLTLDGKNNISSNTCNGKSSNLFVVDTMTKITLGDNFDNASTIGVTVIDGTYKPTAGQFSTNGSAGNVAAFTADDATAYHVAYNAGNYLELVSEGVIEVSSETELTTAISQASGATTIKLTADINLTATVNIASGKEITFDLNGHTLNGAGITDKTKASVITNAGTLTIKDSSASSSGKITGGTGTGDGTNKYGGGIYNTSAGTLTIAGGTISGNKVSDNGGGVYNEGNLVMTGGTISGNEAKSNGGGVFIGGSGNAIMTGGEITNNTGSGVHHSGACLTIGGTAKISGNTKNGKANNLYLPDGKTFSISTNLTAGASIGVTMEDPKDAMTDATATSDNAQYFSSDNEYYKVQFVTDHLELVKAYTEKKKSSAGSAWTSVPTSNGSASAPVSNGSWGSSTGSWKYTVNGEPLRNATAWISYTGADGKQYTGCFYFDRFGIMQLGWQKIDNTWYFFDTTPGSSLGIMRTSGWITTDGKQYYVGADGKMLTSTTTPDGHQVDATGARIDF